MTGINFQVKAISKGRKPPLVIHEAAISHGASCKIPAAIVQQMRLIRIAQVYRINELVHVEAGDHLKECRCRCRSTEMTTYENEEQTVAGSNYHLSTYSSNEAHS